MNIVLNDKVILITGSSRGLGKKMAISLAQNGANVVINYCHDAKAALLTFAEVKKFNNDCLLVKADVSNEDDVKYLYKKVISHYNKIDILINNAGVCSDDYINFMDYRQWDSVIKTNLYSSFFCSRIFSKNMIKNNYGKIINISSLKGQIGSEGQCNYSASKAGMIGITKALAKELGANNISVNAVCPGFIITDLNRKNKYKADFAKNMSTLSCEFALEDFLNFIVYFCSDLVKGVSGQVFNLDSRLL